MSDTKLQVENIGPIETLTIPLPDGGGIVELRGGQGSGKSTALNAASKLLGNERGQRSTVRDGEKRGAMTLHNGVNQCTLKVSARRNTTSGELAVDSIEGTLDLAALVDPGIKDVDAADSHRLKALLSLSGVPAEPSRYYDLVGGKENFDELGIDTDVDCPIKLASRIKSKIEAKAREREKQVETITIELKSTQQQFEGVDLTAPCDQVVLSCDLDNAMEERTRLTTTRDNAETQRKSMREAKQRFEVAVKHYDGPTWLEAETAAATAEAKRDEALAELKAAQAKFDDAQKEFDNATTKHDAAKSHFETVAELQKAMEVEEIASPTDEQIGAAEQDVADAKEAIALGAEVRKALRFERMAKRLEEDLIRVRDGSKRLREMARDVDDVLTSLLPDGPLRIEAGRLVIETDRSKSEPYAELSDGERWKVAIDIVADKIDDNGLIVIPQTAWEGLTRSTKLAIQTHLKAKSIVGLTAKAVDGELHAEIFDDKQ